MSKKSRTTRNVSPLAPKGKSPFSDKEDAIIQAELADTKANERNIPFLLEKIRTDSAYRSLRIDPFHVMGMVSKTHQSYRANLSLSGQPVDETDMMERLLHEFSEHMNPDSVLNVLIPMAKQTKIKREKRALLWAVGELIGTLIHRRSTRESAVIRAVALGSVQYAVELSQKITDFLDGKEPCSFRYEKILDQSFTLDDWQKLLEETETLEPDFTLALSLEAMQLFEQVSRPFGFQFHQIIHYPDAVKTQKKRSILLPGETPPKEDQSQEITEETYNSLISAIYRDIPPTRRLFFAQEFIRSVKAAAFGERDIAQIQSPLNAAVFCFLSSVVVSAFLLRVYQQSGEKADSLNPDDEKNMIIDLKGSPENPRLVRKYAEMLQAKGEKRGALQVYARLLEFPDQNDPALLEHIKALRDTILQEQQEKKENEPSTTSSVILTS